MEKIKSLTLNMDNIIFMRNCKDKEFDVAIVDPEYLHLNENIAVKGTEGGRLLKKGTTFEDFTGKPTEEYFYHLFRISNDQIIFGGNYFTDILDFSLFKITGKLEDIKPFLKSNNNWFVWNKQVADANWSMYELAWVSINNNARSFRYAPMGNVCDWHPTAKPLEVYRYIFESYLNPIRKKIGRNLNLLDTNLGSGSIRIVAYMLGYNLTSTEISKKFYDNEKRDFERYLKVNELLLPKYEIEEFGI